MNPLILVRRALNLTMEKGSLSMSCTAHRMVIGSEQASIASRWPERAVTEVCKASVRH